MVIEINKDIDRYQESVALGLTAKRLLLSTASVVVCGGMIAVIIVAVADLPFLRQRDKKENLIRFQILYTKEKPWRIMAFQLLF